MEEKRRWTIKVSKGQEYRAHKESIYEEDLFFSDVYQQTREHLNEILLAAKSLTDGTEEQGGSTEACGHFLHNAPNNVITFCAERGQGKSSAMKSISSALGNLNQAAAKEEKAQQEAFWGSGMAGKYTYEVLDSIDPTRMTAQDNIVKIVLYRLFMNFKKVWEARFHNRPENWEMSQQRDKLLEQFQTCWHSLEVLQGEATDDIGLESELERLEERGDSSNLRGALYRLIDSYLHFLHQEKNVVLLLQIDDADLNTERVYELLEDARKYLFLPNVVIIMAANITQLESTLEQHFLEEYRESLRYEESMVDVYQCHDIAERYLEKVVPASRRVYLPNLNQTLRESYVQLQIQYRDENGQDLISDQYAQERENWDYQDQLLYFLHRKTGLVYMQQPGRLHGLLPDNMRDLTHFLIYFAALPDVDVGYFDLIDIFARKRNRQERLARWQQNLRQLEHYLVDLWSANNLTDQSRRLFREFAHQSQNSKHRYLLSALPDLYTSEQKDPNLNQEDLRARRETFVRECERVGVVIPNHYISRVEEEPPYATYADAFTALDVLTSMHSKQDYFKFACAVRLHYSIFLHQLLLQHMMKFTEKRLGRFFPKTEQETLSAFMGDGFFRRGHSGSCEAPVVFWYFPVPKRAVTEWRRRLPNMVQPELSAIRQCVRKESNDGYAKRTVPLGARQKFLENERLIFSVQYIWLHQTDLLYLDCQNSETYLHYAEDGERREDMYRALVLTLNADVQYQLYCLAKSENTPDKDDKLSQIMKRWFRSYTVNLVQWEAMHQNDLDYCLTEEPFQTSTEGETWTILDTIRPPKTKMPPQEEKMSEQLATLKKEQKAQAHKNSGQPDKTGEQKGAPAAPTDQSGGFTTDEDDQS